MLSALLKFELLYHARQLSFKIAAVLFFALGLLFTYGSFGGAEVHKNSPYVITVTVGLLSLCCIFACTLFCANVVLRDTACRMEAVLFTTSVKRGHYFTVRFLGLLGVTFVMLCCVVLGIAIGAAGERGDFHLFSFCQPLLVFGLPNVLLAASLLFCTAVFTRSARAVYVAGLLLYILYLTAAILSNSPMMAASALKPGGPDALSVLTDPFGLAAFFGETRSWTSVQRNTQLFPLQGFFLLNRLLWTGFALTLLAVCYRFFAFRLTLGTVKKTVTTAQQEAVIQPCYNVTVHTQGWKYTLSVFYSQLKQEVWFVCKHIPFMALLLLWIFLYTVELKDSLAGPYGIHFYPVTGYLAEAMRTVRPALLLLIFYAAELLTREKAANMQPLVYSTPAPGAVIWAAKCVTLALLVAILITANIGIGLGLQLANAYYQPQWAVYVSLYYYSGLPLFLFAVLILVIQTLTPNKYLGMLLNLFVVALIIFSRRLGIEHYLLRYATVPDLLYAHMNGYGHYTYAFNWYMLYWCAFAIIPALPALRLWQGGRQLTARQRWRVLFTHWPVTARIGLAVSITVWISCGIYIFYQANIRSHYMSNNTQLRWQAAYEQQYKPLAHLPQPVITSVKTTVALHPARAMYTVSGSYRLQNTSRAVISKIWVAIDPSVSNIQITVPGALQQKADAAFHQYWFILKKPLLPGDTLPLLFSLQTNRSGFTAFDSEHSVVRNGTYIELEKFVPFLGYNPGFEITDAYERQRNGLPVQDTAVTTDTAYHLIDLETTISAPADQYVVTTGTLQNTWVSGQHRYFHYKTTAPVNFMFALSAAHYAVKEEMYKGVQLRICYTRGHEQNIAAMLQAMKNTLDYCTQHFGPYTLPQLTLAEIPQYRGAATAYPGVIFGAERINFLASYQDTAQVNQAYAITVHETSHQWWANKLSPANGPGAALLTESLAKYTEAAVLEQHFGREQLHSYQRADNNLYFGMRNTGKPELPLSRTADQPFVYYQKGGLALYAIRQALGEAALNAALQRLLNKHAWPGPRATPADLISELQQGATAAQRQVIEDNLQKVIVFALQLKMISCKPLPGGLYKLQLRVTVNKTDAGKPLSPNDNFDIGLFDGQQLTVQHHHFNKNTTVLTLTAKRKLHSISIDPYDYVLEENKTDNKIIL
ncbi:M1 family aminopeptidase [Chitinophaga sp. GbtcB8]|uniref:M1 family aminopeptidase n=1 Tax=Chitinophaga sp. GbtcB8 TaxID=2824753 RepID=UPI001C3087F3|nr:M1 family aminopeptidase [Chitinophaga sp. GbtcB8]